MTYYIIIRVCSQTVTPQNFLIPEQFGGTKTYSNTLRFKENGREKKDITTMNDVIERKEKPATHSCKWEKNFIHTIFGITPLNKGHLLYNKDT